MRKLTSIEEKRLATLTSMSVEVALIEPTSTGLGKAILDATFPVRNYLRRVGLHDYNDQKQGAEHKLLVKSSLLSEGLVFPSQASLYRPTTKNGDPRIWFRGLPSFCSPNDILAIIAYSGELYVVNLTRTSIEAVVDARTGPIWDLLSTVSSEANSIADELLSKLRKVAASGFIQSVIDGDADTAVGRTLEKLLGIDINSSKQPDYRGIELKSYRTVKKGRENRKTLFAQVPNWELSKFKSSREILDNFGYTSGVDFKLYCTVSARKKNSQGLQFQLQQEDRKLFETSDKQEVGAFATWLVEDLHNRLVEKHNETFWVSANSKKEAGKEYFNFTHVTHTRRPIVSQFDVLLEQGIITMDHLIKRNSKGRVSEKGPLFKIEAASLGMLFPPPLQYDLRKA